MGTTYTEPDTEFEFSTLGPDAVDLGPYEDTKAADADEWIIYHEDEEDAWVQSDTYFSREGMV